MNQKERKAINAVVQLNVHHKATAAQVDDEHGYVSHHEEATRLMDSEDYRKGWEACHQEMRQHLAGILAGDKKLIKDLIRNAEKERS